MNRPIRRVAAAVGVLMLALLINLNYVQVVKSDSYRDNPGNRRVLLDEYSRQRGSIIVDGMAVADSVKSPDRLKYLRTYPDGPVYADLTGYYSEIFGTEGLEASEQALLSGSDSRLFTSRFADLITGRVPRGGNLTLTINAKVQAAAYKALNGRRGAVVALDPATGAILAAVSTPSYDPNLLTSHHPDAINAAWTKYTKDPSTPLLNRAFDQLYPPGSMFKVIDAAAALKAGRTPATVLAAPTRYLLPGTRTYLENYNGEICSRSGRLSLDQALTISCNTAFAKLAVDLGAPAIRAEAEQFGLTGQGSAVPLAVAASTVGAISDQAKLAETGIGQQDVRVTPLQAAMISAAVANKGVLMKPYLIARETRPNLSVLATAEPQKQSQPVTAAQAATLTTMMEHVVARGTGRGAQIPGVTVAGKTGTAETVKGASPHAWFTGFAPANKPRIAVAVLLENGGIRGNETTGGKASAPIAATVMRTYLDAVGGH